MKYVIKKMRFSSEWGNYFILPSRIVRKYKEVSYKNLDMDLGKPCYKQVKYIDRNAGKYFTLYYFKWEPKISLFTNL